MKNDADIFDRVYRYGMEKATLEAIKNKLQAEVCSLKTEKIETEIDLKNVSENMAFFEQKHEAVAAEKERVQRELETTLKHFRLLKAENDELKSVLAKGSTIAIAALKVIRSGGASKMGAKQYSSEVLKRIEDEEEKKACPTRH